MKYLLNIHPCPLHFLVALPSFNLNEEFILLDPSISEVGNKILQRRETRLDLSHHRINLLEAAILLGWHSLEQFDLLVSSTRAGRDDTKLVSRRIEPLEMLLQFLDLLLRFDKSELVTFSVQKLGDDVEADVKLKNNVRVEDILCLEVKLRGPS